MTTLNTELVIAAGFKIVFGSLSQSLITGDDLRYLAEFVARVGNRIDGLSVSRVS